jgi:integrase
MAKIAKEMSAMAVKALTKQGSYAVGGVPGLNLRVQDGGTRSWVMRYLVDGKRYQMGLGPFPEVGLADARDKARAVRKLCAEGHHPLKHRKVVASQRAAEQAKLKTFKQSAVSYIEAHGHSWKNAKHRAQWESTLENYVYPVMGDLLVQDVGQDHVLKVLEPIWRSKNETAARIRGRIELVLDFAKASGHRTGENPAVWKGHLDKLLPQPSKVKQVTHQRALNFSEMPTFMAALRKVDGVSARALEFLVLCAVRSGEVRGALWAEIDLVQKVWTIPAQRMKAGVEHRVPLSAAAVDLLKATPQIAGCQLVFPGRKLQPLSDMSLTAVIRRMDVDAVPHGFRSTFRDWAGEVTEFPREVAEAALAHTLTNKTEAAYRRGDALDKRRVMMEAWALHCSDKPKHVSMLPPEGLQVNEKSRKRRLDRYDKA